MSGLRIRRELRGFLSRFGRISACSEPDAENDQGYRAETDQALPPSRPVPEKERADDGIRRQLHTSRNGHTTGNADQFERTILQHLRTGPHGTGKKAPPEVGRGDIGLYNEVNHNSHEQCTGCGTDNLMNGTTADLRNSQREYSPKQSGK